MKDYSKEMNLKENWKLSELPYKRPDFDEIKKSLDELCDKVKNAESYDEVRKCIKESSDISCELDYAAALAYIRCYGDSSNEFYAKELPDLLSNCAMVDTTKFGRALLESKFADDVDKEFGTRYLDIVRSDIKLHKNGRELMAKEQQLIGEYQNIKSTLRFKFNGEELSESELRKYTSDDNRETRKAALKTLYKGFNDKSDKMFDILRKLVNVRNEIAEVNGFDNYLDYINEEKGRDNYGEKELTSFCNQVKKDLVPFYKELYKAQAERIGIDHICAYDADYLFSDGNPKPCGDADYLINAAKEMYEDMSEDTGKIFNYMTCHELFDIKASKNKIAGIGFCTDLGKLKGCVIFNNCNGTDSDMTVLTHEFGHAIQGYLSFEDQPILNYCDPCNDAVEIPSKVMEQFALPYAENFFGKDADKFRFLHMQGCLIEISGYCYTHEFETYLYAHPDDSNEEWVRNFERIKKEYLPEIDMTEVDDLLNKGAGLFTNMGVYMFPRYLISYSLCDMCALEMKARRDKSKEEAWNSYMKLCRAGGSMGYADLVKTAGLTPAYEEGIVKKVTEPVKEELRTLINKGI